MIYRYTVLQLSLSISLHITVIHKIYTAAAAAAIAAAVFHMYEAIYIHSQVATASVCMLPLWPWIMY